MAATERMMGPAAGWTRLHELASKYGFDRVTVEEVNYRRQVVLLFSGHDARQDVSIMVTFDRYKRPAELAEFVDQCLAKEAASIESDIPVTVEAALRDMASMPHGDLVAELKEYQAQKAVRLESMRGKLADDPGLFTINNPPDPMPDKIVMEPTDAELERTGPIGYTVAEKRELLRVGKEEVEARDMREESRLVNEWRDWMRKSEVGYDRRIRVYQLSMDPKAWMGRARKERLIPSSAGVIGAWDSHGCQAIKLHCAEWPLVPEGERFSFYVSPFDCSMAATAPGEEVEEEERPMTRRDMDRLARMAIGEADIIAMLTGRFYSRVTNLPADAKIQCVKHEPENRCFVWTVWSMSFPVAEPCSMLPFIEAKMERLKNAESRPPVVSDVHNRDWRLTELLCKAIEEAGLGLGGPVNVVDAIGFPCSYRVDFLDQAGKVAGSFRFDEEELHGKTLATVATVVRNRFSDHFSEAKNAESRPMA